MNILVIGGAGYIGSHMVKLLLEQGHAVTTLDNLSTGHRDAVQGGEFIQGDFEDRALLGRLFVRRRFDAVMHFASCIEVGESMRDPAKYYRNNVVRTLGLLDTMVEHQLDKFIFSSTAAVFGEPRYLPIDEHHPLDPINPYGATKQMVERILADYDRAYGLRHVSLRYFNACGADPSGLIGEGHEPETHLIPLVLQAASGRRGAISVFGDDYDTADGTCVRDYVHVVDLCHAHLLALNQLDAGAPSACYNLGNGGGYSVRQVIAAVERVTGRQVPKVNAPRRPGDPARLVADSARAQKVLRWNPVFADLDVIVEHAWRWELRLCAYRQSAGNADMGAAMTTPALAD